MAIYALVGPANEIKFIQEQPDPSVAVKPGWRWLPVVDTYAACDPLTQIMCAPQIAVLSASVTRVWGARARSADEIERDALGEIDAIEAAKDRRPLPTRRQTFLNKIRHKEPSWA